MNKDELLKYINNYKVYKQRSWKSWKSKRNNAYYFELLISFLDNNDFDRDGIVNFFNSLEGNKSESTRRQAETCILAFAKWLHREGITDKDLGHDIDRTQIHRKPHILPDQSEVLELIREATEPGTNDNRLTTFSKMEHRACLSFIVVACGGRNSETSRIQRTDVSVSGREIEIVYGKNGSRVVGIPEVPWLISELEKRVKGLRTPEETIVLSDRTHYKETDVDRLFVVNEKKLEETMRKVGDLWGKPLCVHDLRRIFARDMKKNGADLDDIRIAMGHKNIETTLRYLYDDPSEIQRIINEYNSEARKYHTRERKFKELVNQALEIGIDVKSSLSGEFFEIKGKIPQYP